MQARIRRIEFSNFKAFGSYSLTVGEINILVGPNNSGKSTIIGALRTLDAAVRFARTRPPTRLYIGEDTVIGYRIPEESVPISLENVQTDYNGIEARITFFLSNGNTLALIFPEDGGCALIPQLDGGVLTSAAIFKREFPISTVVVPVLGPVEHNEHRRERSTVVAGLSTHRASRHFRSFWHYNPEGFKSFADLIAKTWPGMSISGPECDNVTGQLAMFCMEGRMTRELYLGRVRLPDLVPIADASVASHRERLGCCRRARGLPPPGRSTTAAWDYPRHWCGRATRYPFKRNYRRG